MSKKLLNLCLTALLSLVGTTAWALSQVDGVYQIGTADDLKAFAELVNSGEVNAQAVLTADIDKGADGTMIGCDVYNYNGTFDGAGHTITINMFSAGENGTALFRNLADDAYIKDLKVVGTITTNTKYAAGIAAWGKGTVRGCYVDINIVSAVAGDATHGGIFGVAYQGTMIENCLAKITINGATSTNCGGVVGWCDNRTNIINCLVVNDGSSFSIDSGSGTVGRNDGNLQTVNLENYIGNEYDNRPGGASTNNYATNAWGNTKCVNIISYDDLADGRICYQLNTDQSHIAWVQNIGTDPFPVPAAFGSGRVYASAPTGCDGKAEGEITYSNEGSDQAEKHQFDKFGICPVCGCFNFYALERDPVDGYYLLKTPEDIDIAEGWNRITNGGCFSLKMANDIEYTAEPGRYIFNTSNWFDGSFNGDGHELTIHMTEMTGNNAALFPKFAGYKFENVIIHGDISTSGQYAGSVAGQTYRDRVVIKNVFSDLNITTTHAGDNTTGGLIGIVETKTQVENTIYAGSITGTENTECLAGFAGWASGQTYYTNCAFIGTITGDNGNSQTLSRNPSKITCANVYSLAAYGENADADKYTLIDPETVESGELAYNLNGKKGGVERFYQIIGTDIFPYPIKKDGALVYASAASYRCDGAPEGDVTYVNTDPGNPVLPAHQYEDGFCEVCGGLQEDYITPVDGWFEISTPEQLVWWTNYAAVHLDASARLTDDIDFSDYAYLDEEGNCMRWANVGTEGAPFYGNFDGQFHIISNLKIYHPQDNGVGLVAVMNSLPSKNYGGISDADARAAEGVYIKDVVLDETCSITGRGYIGIVGMTAPWAGHVTISGLMMCGDVYANGGPNASGVFGCVMSSSCHVTIDRSGMTGNVYGPTENGSFSGWLGSYAEVTNCYAVGSVEGIQDDAHYFARYSSATFTNCYARYGTQVPTVTEEDFASGALAWRANGSQFRTNYWYQNLDEDPYPFPDPSHGTIIFAAEKYFSVASEEDLDEVIAEVQAYEKEYVGEIIANKDVLDAFNELVDNLEEANTLPLLADALDAISVSKKAVNESEAIYKAYIDKCEEIKARLANDDSFEGDVRNALAAYLSDNIDEPSEENPLGSYEYIVENHTATNEEIKAEQARIEEWLKEAIASGYVVGTEVSDLIPNSDFSQHKEKWNNAWSTGIGTTIKDAEGKTVVGVEAWNVTGDQYQTVEGMKPGYYLVGTHAAFRPSNNRYSTNYAAGIYANGTFNYFPAVIDDYIAVADAVDQVNCNLEGAGAHDLAIYDDGVSTSDDTGAELIGYAVHGETGMAAAANADRYKVFTIAKVGEDGQLTIGIKNPGTKYGNDWTGWSALKVTYCGEDAEDALATVLENMVERANVILADYEEHSIENAAADPNFPEALRDELKGLVDQSADFVASASSRQEAKGKASVEDMDALVGKFSDIFQRIYEGKQAYIALFNAGNILGYAESANLALVEKDEETGEWIESGENLFTQEEMDEVVDNLFNEILDIYDLGSATTEEALQKIEEINNNATVAAIFPAKDDQGFYLIGTPKQLAGFRAISSFVDYTVKGKLTADIDMSGIAMQPINQWDYSYRGTFDGQGYAIENVYINFDGERCGLFNTIDGATVKNLKVTGEYYTGSKYMGGLVGYTYNSKIDNCEVGVKLNSAVNGDGTHGGLIGLNDGSGTVVSNCLITSELLGESTNCCGGVCGWAGAAITVQNSLVLVTGNITWSSCEPISRNTDNLTSTNNFYQYNISGSTGQNVTDEQLASGEATYKLNGSKSTDVKWFQTIGTEAKPHLFGSDVVYYYGGQYMNEKPNPQLNAFAYNLDANLRGSDVVVTFNLNAEAESATVKFSNGYTQAVDQELKEGAYTVTVPADQLGENPTALTYEVEVKGKGTKEVTKVGDSYKVWGPYGMDVNNNPQSKGFGQVLLAESWIEDEYNNNGFTDYHTGKKIGALFAFDAAFKPVNASDGTPGFYGGLELASETPLVISGSYTFDLKDLRFTKDGRLFVARASGLSNSSVWEINPDDLNEDWKPVFTGGDLDEATGITYVGEEEQNRMALGMAVEGEGDDLKLYVLGGQRSNGDNNTTDFNCAIYNLGVSKQYNFAAPSAYFAPLEGVYTISPNNVGIHEDGQGGLWYIQYRSTPSETNPALKHYDAEGNEDYSDVSTATTSGRIACTADGKYIAIPMGSGKIVLYETNYVPMANGKIYLNPIFNIAVSESSIASLAFDYAGNLYVASGGTETFSRYAIPSLNDNLATTPGRPIGTASALGDVNADGKVDIADAVSVLNIMAEGTDAPVADVNGDGKVDIADFVSVLNIMAEQ